MLKTEDKLDAEQTKHALEHIAHMACALQAICSEIEQGKEDGDFIMAASNLAAKIGWTADRCLNFEVRSSDKWLMPYGWNQIADKKILSGK
jgi:hypothetical protein